MTYLSERKYMLKMSRVNKCYVTYLFPCCVLSLSKRDSALPFFCVIHSVLFALLARSEDCRSVILSLPRESLKAD